MAWNELGGSWGKLHLLTEFVGTITFQNQFLQVPRAKPGSPRAMKTHHPPRTLSGSEILRYLGLNGVIPVDKVTQPGSLEKF